MPKTKSSEILVKISSLNAKFSKKYRTLNAKKWFVLSQKTSFIAILFEVVARYSTAKSVIKKQILAKNAIH
ncbi:hypothetical protein CR66_00755 [Campylobacter mucosalis]|nr:hypothetical protein CR66_00755 [Campylobacter mucosalis]